ncbi:MAG TPA: DUF4114 domain-containing protein [Segetibacter sp.]|jgi:hypothetical protein
MKRFLPLIIALIAINACKKDVAPAIENVEFKTTTYQTLGAFDNAGRPFYLEPADVISSNLRSFASNTLPEFKDLRNSRPELLATSAVADIAITKSSEVFITYVSQGTENADALGFYTFPTNDPPDSVNDIKTITNVFPYLGEGSPINPGSKVRIGRFDAGISVGFVLMQGAWDKNAHKINNIVPHFLTNDKLNPEINAELKKHAVLVNYPSENKVLIGFEDIFRTDSHCDHDFNDVVVYATVTP